ncbi:hypothetical protein [uncultured Desulfovibrio sp.]|uniref:hypothetical protein n=1 Tax=uncultured Desulfovibrio sp. TaxID=167968 RepID=UPI0025FB9F76|nr:hypothetical protein [uncultured Desulfovibrio sp.]
MQIENGYAAIGNIFEISPSHGACRLSAHGTRTSCDTVSISEEARVAYTERGGDAASLTERFPSAVASRKTQPQAGHAVRETLHALEEESIGSATGQESGAAARFRKQFAAYRGNGIFAENRDAPENASLAAPEEDTQTTEAEKVSKKASELERKIRDLSAQLESVMASGMPETEKNAMSTRISKEIEELQSQLTAYKQAEKALSET